MELEKPRRGENAERQGRQGGYKVLAAGTGEKAHKMKMVAANN